MRSCANWRLRCGPTTAACFKRASRWNWDERDINAQKDGRPRRRGLSNHRVLRALLVSFGQAQLKSLSTMAKRLIIAQKKRPAAGRSRLVWSRVFVPFGTGGKDRQPKFVPSKWSLAAMRYIQHSGTRQSRACSIDMREPLPILTENALQIAWDYLEQTGQIENPEFTSRFLLVAVQHMISQGERRRLALANLAIAAYERLDRSGLAA
jgi:hypothetical protein